MTSFKSKDYLELLKRIVDYQYDDPVDDYDIDNIDWIPAESDLKEKALRTKSNGIIDLTNVKSGLIKEEILKNTNLKIGSFKIRINRYCQSPSQKGGKMSVDLEVWETKTKTPSGNPCNMDFPAHLYKDNRFAKKTWLDYFRGNSAKNVPIDIAVEIVRWMQGIHRLTAFL